jgi:type IV pilus biogenesis protein CpaD/CtpE
MTFKTIATTVAFIGLTACSSSNRVEDEYGESVRQMINAQVYDPATLTNPSDKPVEGADPDMVNNAIQTLREHVGAPEEVSKDLVVRVGGQGR